MLNFLNFFVFQWFFVRRIRVLVPLWKKYQDNGDRYEYENLIRKASDRPINVMYPPGLYDFLTIGFVEHQWVRAVPLTGWIGRLWTF